MKTKSYTHTYYILCTIIKIKCEYCFIIIKSINKKNITERLMMYIDFAIQ